MGDVTERASLCDGADGGNQRIEVGHALLQHIGAAGAASVEQCECVARIRVLAEDDHAETRVCLP
jgi:hypothetical protein